MRRRPSALAEFEAAEARRKAEVEAAAEAEAARLQAEAAAAAAAEAARREAEAAALAEFEAAEARRKAEADAAAEARRAGRSGCGRRGAGSEEEAEPRQRRRPRRSAAKPRPRRGRRRGRGRASRRKPPPRHGAGRRRAPKPPGARRKRSRCRGRGARPPKPKPRGARPKRPPPRRRWLRPAAAPESELRGRSVGRRWPRGGCGGADLRPVASASAGAVPRWRDRRAYETRSTRPRTGPEAALARTSLPSRPGRSWRRMAHRRPTEPGAAPTTPADAIAASAEPQWPTEPEWPDQRVPLACRSWDGRRRRPAGWKRCGPSRLARSPRRPPGGPAARAVGGVQPCVSCGLSLSANARFCRRCGTRQG